MTITFKAISDGREQPRVSETKQIFGNANPVGSGVTYVNVTSSTVFSDKIDMFRYNNIACEVDTIMGSGTDCIELVLEYSSDGENFGKETAENFAEEAGSILMEALPRRFRTSERKHFPITFIGSRFVQFGHRVPVGCSGVGTQIAMSVNLYETEQ